MEKKLVIPLKQLADYFSHYSFFMNMIYDGNKKQVGSWDTVISAPKRHFI